VALSGLSLPNFTNLTPISLKTAENPLISLKRPKMDYIWQFQGRNRFLSNFYPALVKFEGLSFPTAENAYQASKTLNRKVRKQFLHLPPGDAKRMGQIIPLRPMWEFIKLQTMEEILLSKFQDEGLALMLKETYPRKLFEGNHWGDRYWGICFDQIENKWVGENHLGKILMRIRSGLLTDR
jgi:ribA/ribD-fused uncharacterized protein